MLQEHIDELTQERFELRREVEQTRSLMHSLVAENEALAEQYNSQGRAVDALRAELERCEREIEGQITAVQGMGAERNAARAALKSAEDRAKALIAENLALEDRNRHLRSSELKLQQELEGKGYGQEPLRRELQTVSNDRAQLRAQVEALQEEKRQLTAKLRSAALQRELAGPHEGPAPAPAPAPSAQASPTTPAAEAAAATSPAPGAEAAAKAAENPRTPPPAKRALQLPSASPAAPVVALMRSTSGHFAGTAPVSAATGAQVVPVLPTVGGDEDPLAMAGNIHALLTSLEEERARLAGELRAARAATAAQETRTRELSQSLAAQTQRLELLASENAALSGAAGAGGGAAAAAAATGAAPLAPDGEEEVDAEETVDTVLSYIVSLLPFVGRASRRAPPP